MLNDFTLNKATLHFRQVGLCRTDENVSKRIYFNLTVVAFVGKYGYFFGKHARSYPFLAELEILFLILSVESVSDINLCVRESTL